MKVKATISQLNDALEKIRSVGGVAIVRKQSDSQAGGSFDVKGVEGLFNFDKQEEVLTITILDKPWLASDAMIEEEIKKFFR